MPPLSELTVVDLSAGIAGGYCGKLLADAGARVRLLEEPAGHPLRRQRPAPPPAAPGLLFDFLANDKAIENCDPGSEHADACITHASLVVADASSERWLPARRPRHAPMPMIVEISPWGPDGPWSGRPATDLVVQAACGSIARRGVPGREPVQAGGSLTEWTAVAYAAAAAASFWWGLGTKSSGLHLEVAQLECATVSLQPFTMIDAVLRGGTPGGPHRAPSIPSIEPTRDGFVGFSTITAQQFRDFLVMIERPDLAAEPGLVRYDERERRRDELVQAIHRWTRARDTDEIVRLATSLRIPVAPIGNGQNLPMVDHFAARARLERDRSGHVRPKTPYIVHPLPAGPIASGFETAAPPSAAAPAPPSVPAPAPVPTRNGSGSGPPERDQPMAGLRVADFTAFWAGPSVTHLLAGLGAEVVKIESLQRPDAMRLTSARPGDERWLEWSAVFHGVNANKRSITLDLTDRRGHELACQLIARSDVVIENFSPRVMDGFGLGWEKVSSINPAVVMVRMPAFGLSGPWRDRTGFAMTVEQASGLAWRTGYADGPPMDVGGVCDPLGGMHGVVALVAALGRRQETGEGCLVEVPLVDVALNAAAEQLLQFSATGQLLGRTGNRDPTVAPQGVYRCLGDDEWLALSVLDAGQWHALRRVVGLPSWADDPALDDVEGRASAHDRIDERLSRWCLTAGSDELAERLIARGVPAAAVTAPAAVTGNPQLVARGFFETLEHPVVGRYTLPSLPFQLRGIPRRWIRSAPPTLGQHNREVLEGRLGLDARAFRDLEESRVVGDDP